MRRSIFVLSFGVALAHAGPMVPMLDAQTPSAAERPTAAELAAIRSILGITPGASLSRAQLIDRLRQSGLTREQVRSELGRRGYDPSLADRYFDAMEEGAAPGGAARPDTLVPPPETEAAPPADAAADTLAAAEAAQDSAGDAATPTELEIFGRSLFSRNTTEFTPPTVGPVDPDYRLGPGDELLLVLTGDVEAVHKLPVSREGFVLIPDVGQVAVNGLTLAQINERLYDRLGRVYSGVKRGPDATTRFQVSLGRLRVNQVYVIGEVERPSAYQVSAASSVFDALYRAGGPNENGSFRAIDVYRGGERVATVDLYDYLLYGRSPSDVRLEHGDRIFVRPYARRVTVRGAVRRPAIYELAEGDDLRDAIAFAGGLDATAIVQRVQIDRILPPELRRPGVDRVLIDVELSRLMEPTAEPVALRDGDVIEVFAVSDERRHRVVLTGEVRRPGTYEWSDGLRLLQLIDRAGGLAEQAYTPRVHVYRLIEETGGRRVIRVALPSDSAGAAGRDLLLADRDSIVVYSRAELRNEEFVDIDGFVKRPGRYPLAAGMTVQDLVLAAGGFTEGADTRIAEVARMPDPAMRGDTMAEVFTVVLDGPAGATGGGADGLKAGVPAGASPDVPVWVPDSAEYVLRSGDRVFIRKAVGYEVPRTVTITGEVLVPGRFVLETRGERIVDLIKRAGGLTDQAYAPGLQLFRDGNLVATDLFAALADEESRYNVALEPGDSIHVPAYSPTVLVTGAVAFETLVLYEPGESLDYYINQAGGYLDIADKDRVTVTYMDGERATIRRTLVFRRTPPVQPGSTIVVPAKPLSERVGFSLDRLLTRTAGILGSVLAIWLTVNQLSGDGGG
ncbi:MAG TPA: SLBB domain-containing protein [Longimicrobiales bacterium]